MKNLEIKKLLKLVNPFEDDILGIGSPLNKEEILRVINEKDYSINSSDNLLQKTTKKIAFFSCNPQEETVVINLSNEKQDIIQEGKYTFIASLINNEEYLKSYLLGNDKVANKILKSDVNQESDIPEIKKINEDDFLNNVSFVIHKNEFENKWSDPDFVLEKLNTDHDKNVEFVSDTLWHDPIFLLDMIKKNYEKDTHEWNKNYPDMKYMITDEVIDYVFNDMNDFTNFNMVWEVFYKDSKFTIGYKAAYAKVKEKFKNSEWVLKYIENNKIDYIYPHLPKELQLNRDVIKNYVSSKASYGLNYKNVPKEFYKNIDDIIFVFKEGMDLRSRMSDDFDIFKRLEVSKEDIIKFINIVPAEKGSLIIEMWDYGLNYNYKKDKDIIISSMNICNDIYFRIKAHMNDPEIIDKYLRNKGKIKNLVDALNEFFNKDKNKKDKIKEILFNLDDELITNCIKENPGFLLSPACPSIWKEKIEHILCLNKNINELGFSSKKWEKILGDDLTKYTQILKLSPSVYDDLSEEKKLIPDLYNIYINFDNCSLSNIPNKLWGSRDFCLKLILLNNTNIFNSLDYNKYIPEAILNDKIFIKTILEKIDNKALPAKVLGLNQQLKKMFETYGVKENFLKEFETHLLKTELLKKDLVPNRRLKI